MCNFLCISLYRAPPNITLVMWAPCIKIVIIIIIISCTRIFLHVLITNYCSFFSQLVFVVVAFLSRSVPLLSCPNQKENIFHSDELGEGE